MKKELLNVAWLNGAMPIKNDSSGGVTINNQDKTVDITENGTTNVTADSEFTGLGKVTVNTAIPTEELNVDIDDVGTKTITPSKGYFSKVTVNTNIPLEDKVIDVTENGTMEIVPESGYFSKVTVNTSVGASGDASIRPTFTGHADVEGLKAIGWTDEDIAYYQANGVNWNEENDEYHKVPEDNIALYGVLTESNISTYKDRIVYLPKITISRKYLSFYSFTKLHAIPKLDTSKVTDMSGMFENCYALASVPPLDTSSATDMNEMFYKCYTLTSIPQFDTSKVTNMSGMFKFCYSLVSIPQLDTSSVTSMSGMFYNCYSFASIPQLDTSSVTNMNEMFSSCYALASVPPLDTSSVTSMGSTFLSCYSLTSISYMDISNVIDVYNMFTACISVRAANLKGLKESITINSTTWLEKSSLLYIINNEAATSAITIKLTTYCYDKYAEDADVVAALANHPNISLAK